VTDQPLDPAPRPLVLLVCETSGTVLAAFLAAATDPAGIIDQVAGTRGPAVHDIDRLDPARWQVRDVAADPARADADRDWWEARAQVIATALRIAANVDDDRRSAFLAVNDGLTARYGDPGYLWPAGDPHAGNPRIGHARRQAAEAAGIGIDRDWWAEQPEAMHAKVARWDFAAAAALPRRIPGASLPPADVTQARWLAALHDLHVAVCHTDGTWLDDDDVAAALRTWLTEHGVDPDAPPQVTFTFPHGTQVTVDSAGRVIPARDEAAELVARLVAADERLTPEHLLAGYKRTLAGSGLVPADPELLGALAAEHDREEAEQVAYRAHSPMTPVPPAGMTLAERARWTARYALTFQAGIIDSYPDVAFHGTPGGNVAIETRHGTHLIPLTNVGYRHSPAGLSWGGLGSGCAALAKSLLTAALGRRAICSSCAGTGRVTWIGTHGHEPYRGAAHDELVVTAQAVVSSCDACDEDGIRRLPYQRLKEQVISPLDMDAEWRLTRADVLAWLTAQDYDPAVADAAAQVTP
jgi:hypothetical protein